MRIDNARELSSIESVANQLKRLLAMRDIAGVDQRRRVIVVEQHNIIRRNPATFEYAHRRSHDCGSRAHDVRRPASCAHTARFSSSPICDHRTISSIERKQPSHQPLAASILQTEMQGDGTGESGWVGGTAFKPSRFASIAASD